MFSPFMATLGMISTLLIAALHLWILVLEMFRWERPRTRAIFGTSPEFARDTKVLAANQGLYNGFLAAGLIWGLVRGDHASTLFFLTCVAVAGIYGGLTGVASDLSGAGPARDHRIPADGVVRHRFLTGQGAGCALATMRLA
ncbi:MAG: DUF1304 domain-containing protein [Paracoccus sp. (in: a-proteobacteria)]